MSDDSWETIEGKFRLWSFRIYYERTFAREHDLSVRFVRALLASTAPICDRQLVLDWYAKRRRKNKDADATTLSTAGR